MYTKYFVEHRRQTTAGREKDKQVYAGYFDEVSLNCREAEKDVHKVLR